jgi:hypothetical protein
MEMREKHKAPRKTALKIARVLRREAAACHFTTGVVLEAKYTHPKKDQQHPPAQSRPALKSFACRAVRHIQKKNQSTRRRRTGWH